MKKILEEAKQNGIITRYKIRKTGCSVELDLGERTWKSFIEKENLEHYMKLENEDILIIQWEKK